MGRNAPRPITKRELRVLRSWLAHDVEGAKELRGQLSERTQVFSSCDCGCASIGFSHIESDDDDALVGVSVFDIGAEIVDDDGSSIGGMMLLLRSGRLHDVDVHGWFGEVAFPTLANTRWHPSGGHSTRLT